MRLHLDDSLADNGPLRVLPGTHRLGRLSDVEIAGLQRAWSSAFFWYRGVER